MTTERIQEVLRIMRDVKNLGFPTDYPPMKELSLRMNEYVKTGQGWSGKIRFKEYDRVAEILLPTKPTIPIQVIFKFKKF
jgi:hypothetical protein